MLKLVDNFFKKNLVLSINYFFKMSILFNFIIQNIIYIERNIKRFNLI
jgi:hypothetical protein